LNIIASLLYKKTLDNKKDKKAALRKHIRQLKESYVPEDFKSHSGMIFSNLEQLPVFLNARNILIYHSLDDEVHTLDFVNKWADKKNFYFPVVDGDNLLFRKYHASTNFRKANLNVYEPDGDNITEYSDIDMVIVPGIAFDKKKNRLGRGKGYYDRFLANISAVKIGVCFNFQLLDEIPADMNDISMDWVITEKHILEKNEDKI